jgi:hypothetical protein
VSRICFVLASSAYRSDVNPRPRNPQIHLFPPLTSLSWTCVLTCSRQRLDAFFASCPCAQAKWLIASSRILVFWDLFSCLTKRVRLPEFVFDQEDRQCFIPEPFHLFGDHRLRDELGGVLGALQVLVELAL